MGVHRAPLALLAVIGVAAGLVGAGQGAVQVAPTALTGSVSSVGGTTATLNGTVNPNGLATTWQFEYGTTTGYGSKAPATAQSAGAGTTNQSVSTALSGLTPGTTYHYRLTATSNDGTTVGADGIFATQAAPEVSTGAASQVGPTQATVACSIDPNGLATNWYVEFGLTTSYGTQTSAQNAGSGNSAVNVSATLTGLQTAKTYHYRCVGTSSADTTRGADATFNTANPPSATTSAATSVGATSARLNARITPNGRPTTYFFEYGTSTSYGSKTSSASAGNGTSTISVSRSISSLTPGTLYHFRVVATSDAGTTPGADLTFLTQAPPSVVTGGANNLGPTSATVSGTVNPNGRSTSWYVEWGTSTSYGARSSARNIGSGQSAVGVSATLNGLGPGTLYHYRIVASNAHGTTRGADATFTTTGIPAVATGQVVFTALGPTSAKVTGVVNPRGLAATAWIDYGRTTTYGRRSPQVTVPAGTSDQVIEFALTGLTPGVRYHFRVVAQSSAGSAAGVDKSFGTPRATGPGGRVIRCTIYGTQGVDVLVGTDGNDILCGLGGNDRLVGRGGNDLLVGGPGNDLLVGGAGKDILQAGSGNDVLNGGLGADRLEGGDGADQLLGGAGRDLLLGGRGSDSIAARDRNRDVVDGGRGFDTAVVDEDLDRVGYVERRRAA
jgi:phosphodiesterase/alkaline phosphatase D-like protein